MARRRPWLRQRWARMAAVLGAVLAVYVAWQVFGRPFGHREIVSDVFAYPFDFAAAAAAWAAARRCASQPRLRTAWRLLSLAFVANFVGDIVWTIYELIGKPPYPSVADGFYLLFYPLMLWGVLRFPG